ncbi:hypothetical protein C8R45DRAFT_1117323 [Mycena sanguinolenta]|nr:hypothetical protein C8R45DRAFT_1117323 [Mycena sanguinolenta]
MYLVACTDARRQVGGEAKDDGRNTATSATLPHLLPQGLRLQSASRWQSLRFSPYAPGWLLEHLADSRLDFLEEFELRRVLAGDAMGFEPSTIHSFTNAPRLRRLTLNPYVAPIPIPWVQLTDITLTAAITSDILLDIFAHWIYAGIHAMQFLDYLSTPALDELHLHFLLDRSVEWAEATFAAFQQRSPNITKLKIGGRGLFIPPDALIAALRHAPSLTHLLVDDFCGAIDDTLLEALCFTHDVEPLVPRLHSLALAVSVGFPQLEDVLANLITSQWWTDAELMLRSEAPAVDRQRRIKLRDDSNCLDQFPGFTPRPQF